MRGMKRFLMAVVVAAAPATAQTVSKMTPVHVVRPERVEPTDERVQGLRVVEGFAISRFADKLGKPRMVAVAPDGTVFVTRREEGDLLRLRDGDGDGRAEQRDTILQMKGLHGIFIHEGTMYLADVKNVYTVRFGDGDFAKGAVEAPRRIISDLPDGGQHPNRTLAVGPDGKLYITVGSTCNACKETNPEAATVLRANLDGSSRTIFASGLRNTVGLDWHPVTGELWGMDHGIDDMGDDVPGEELNRLEEGKDYGWPFVSNSEFNESIELPPDMTREKALAQNTAPVILYTAHASPLAFAFARRHGERAADAGGHGEKAGGGGHAVWGEDAVMTMRGSWNRKPPSGYEVVRVRFENGKPTRFEPLVTGFLSSDGKTHFGRPTGLAFMPDGSLVFTDDTCGVMYRVSRAGMENSEQR